MWGFFESFALVSDVDRMMVDVHSRRHSRDFLRLLECVESLNMGEEQGICSIHEFELFVHSGREIVPHGRGKSHMKGYICERHVEGNHEVDNLGYLNEIIIVATNTRIKVHM